MQTLISPELRTTRADHIFPEQCLYQHFWACFIKSLTSQRRLSREISAGCVFLAMPLASDEATKDVQGSNDSLVMPQSKLWPGTVGSANTHKSSAHVQISARFSENSKTASDSNLSFNPTPAWFMTSGGNHETRWLQPQTGGQLATPAQRWLCSVLKNWDSKKHRLN